MAGESPTSTIPTTEIPLNGVASPEGLEKLVSGDPVIDSFLDVPEPVASKELHEELGEGPDTKGAEDGLQEKGQEGKEIGSDKVVEEKIAEEGDGTEANPIESSKSNAESLPPSKVLAAKIGDKTVEIDESATFTFKVDGKEVSPQISELIQNYKGKIPWDRHYRQLKEDRSKFDGDVKAIDAKIREIVELSQVDPFKALERTIVMAGKNPADFLQAYLAQAQKTAEAVASKSDEEMKTWINSKRVEYENEKAALERTKLNAEKSELAVNKFITEKQAEHGITEEELEAAWAMANEPDNVRFLAGKTPEQIAETVINYVINVDRPYSLIENTVGEISPELRKDGAFIRELREHFRNYPNFTKDDIKIVVEGYLGKSSSTKSRATPSKEPEAERSRTTRTNPSPASPKKAAKSSRTLEEFDPVSGGDLDGLIELLSKE